VADEGQPCWAAVALVGAEIYGQNTPNNILVDLDTEGMGDLLCNARTAELGIATLSSRRLLQ